MTALVPYTNTYSDVDGTVMDDADLVDEFWRVAEFLAVWGGSIDAIGREETYEIYIEEINGELAEILPANGLIQRLEVAADVEQFEIKINEHTAGAPYRVFITVRCHSRDTRFTLSVPAGQSHIFGVNRSLYMPGQVIGDGFYNASLIVTYSQNTGVMVQVHAANPEEVEVSYDDILQLVSE